MAFTPTNIKDLKPVRGARQSDTIGQLFTRTFSFTIPAGTTATTGELTGITLPANMCVTGCHTKSSLASTANSTVAFSTTTGAKVFGAATALVASNTTTQHTPHAVTTPAATPAGDSTVTVTIGTATEANAVNVTCTVVGYSLDATVAPFTTFTV